MSLTRRHPRLICLIPLLGIGTVTSANDGQVPLLLRRNPKPDPVVKVVSEAPRVDEAQLVGGELVVRNAGPAGLAQFGEGAMYWMAVRVDPVSQGLQVQAVMPGGPAAMGGILEGDILRTAAGRHLNSVNAFVQQVQACSGRGIQLELLRNGKPLTLLVAPGVRLADGAIVMPQDVPAAQEVIEAPPEVTEAPAPVPPVTTKSDKPKPAPAQAEPKIDAREQAMLKQLQQLNQHASELEKQIHTLKSNLAAKEAAEKERQAAEAKTKEDAARKVAEMKAKEEAARTQAEARAKEEAAKKLAEKKAKEEAAKKAAEAKKKEDDRKKPATKKPETKPSSKKSDDDKQPAGKGEKCEKKSDDKKSEKKPESKNDDQKKSDDK